MENQYSIERDDRDEILYHITEGIAGATGEEFFRSLTRHLANALQLRYSFVTECTDESRNRVRALALRHLRALPGIPAFGRNGAPGRSNCQQVQHRS